MRLGRGSGGLYGDFAGCGWTVDRSVGRAFARPRLKHLQRPTKPLGNFSAEPHLRSAIQAHGLARPRVVGRPTLSFLAYGVLPAHGSPSSVLAAVVLSLGPHDPHEFIAG